MYAKLQAELTLVEHLDQPKWLGHLAPHAKIYIAWASIFNSLKGPQDSSLGDCVKMATGGKAVLEHCGAALWWTPELNFWPKSAPCTGVV